MSTACGDAAAARARLATELWRADAAGVAGWADDRSSYPDLRAFDVDHSRVFVGRKRGTAQFTLKATLADRTYYEPEPLLFPFVRADIWFRSVEDAAAAGFVGPPRTESLRGPGPTYLRISALLELSGALREGDRALAREKLQAVSTELSAMLDAVAQFVRQAPSASSERRVADAVPGLIIACSRLSVERVNQCFTEV